MKLNSLGYIRQNKDEGLAQPIWGHKSSKKCGWRGSNPQPVQTDAPIVNYTTTFPQLCMQQFTTSLGMEMIHWKWAHLHIIPH